MLTKDDVKNAEPGDKPKKIYDERGLFLLVMPTGRKLWRFKYSFNGRENLISLGTYPEISLSEARKRRDHERSLVALGKDPSRQRQIQREAMDRTFATVATMWFESKAKPQGEKAPEWVASHSRTVRGRLDQHLVPFIGTRPVAEITTADIVPLMRRLIDAGTHETARRVRQIASDVFCYAIALGWREDDPTLALRVLMPKSNAGVRAAVIKPGEGATEQRLKELAGILNTIDKYRGVTVVVSSALRLIPYVFVRPYELQHAEWSEIDLDRAQWSLPAEKLKMRRPLIVPLSRQAVEILRALKPVTGHSRWVFPSARGAARPMSNVAVLAAMRSCGIEKETQSAHGFRAIARTILDEVLSYDKAWIEIQLAHVVKDPNGDAYNRTAFIKQRTEMMQRWADYLDELKKVDE